MYRIAICLILVFYVGCSHEPVSNVVGQGSVTEGGTVENPDREKAEAFFAALGKVDSAEEEKKLLISFGEWLEQGGYRIKVEMKNGKHILLCPYFPPDTPWAEHSFHDITNLELIPRLENGG